MDRPDTLAVVIVSHESADALPATLAALEPQLREGDEVVVVDCASSTRPEVNGSRLIALDENLGFAGGAKIGVEATSTPLVLLLNPDAVPAPDSVARLRAAAAAHPTWGAWQALVTMADGTHVNTDGGVVHFLGLGWSGGCEEPVSASPVDPHEVAFASGAAMMLRREAWNAAQGFESAYFLYGEDLDLSLRLRLGGWRIGTVPAARVAHDYAFEKGSYKWFHLERNRWWTLLAVYPAPLLLLLAPALAGLEAGLVLVAARNGWLTAKLRSQWAVLRSLPWALGRRRRVQATCSVSASEFAAALTASLESPNLDLPAGSRPLIAAQRGYWRVVGIVLRGLDR